MSNLVVARAEEIVANVVEQINYAGLKEKDLPRGIICVGAGAHLSGLLELLENQSGLNARLGHLPPYIQPAEPGAKRHDLIQTAALLFAGALSGKGDCLDFPAQEEEKEEPSTPEYEPEREKEDSKMKVFFRGLSSKFSNIFAPPADDESELD